MCLWRLSILVLNVVSLALAACGLSNPQIQEIWDKDYPGDQSKGSPRISGSAQIEFEIKKRIYCELRKAVIESNNYPVWESDNFEWETDD
jgi:hypothetical protein